MIQEMSAFHPIISDWFRGRFGQISEPQLRGWPVIAAGKHTLILSPTGTGKTLAAFLWCINDLFSRSLDSVVEGVHTLYISPLKALNNDIHRNLEIPLQEIRQRAQDSGLELPPLRHMVRTGDTAPDVRQNMLRKPPQILITTPESLYLLLTSEKGRKLFAGLRYLIVDEIHAMADSKRGVHLSLSLERLMPLCANQPVRIGLSATQRPLERIAHFLGGELNGSPRPVTIVECPVEKKTDLRIIAPVADFTDLPESTVWPEIVNKIHGLITSHRSTLVFVHMRVQSEKLARLLNEKHRAEGGRENSVIAQPHHGSMSREFRFEIEEQLKRGQLPAVIATASLELGIDIGAIDLVIQLGAPHSVSSALQRIGRSGHSLAQQSKGIIIPMFPGDIDDAVALSRSVLKREIEETRIPENSLDVLAQQIIAEVAVQDWNAADLFRLIRGSYCYRNLPRAAFDGVIAMVSGSFSGSNIPALQARISFDPVNDRLTPFRGARLLATLNGGTIPDRGYYAVYLAESNVRLGEMEEEFVFESRVGDTFFLGNSEWRIEQIAQDRIIVTPVQSVKPRPPFWKGEIPYSDYDSSLKIARFREELAGQIHVGSPVEWLTGNFPCDVETAENLTAYFSRQIEVTGQVAGEKKILVEWFYDAGDELNMMFHTPFGGRVNAPWALAVSGILNVELGSEIQFAFNDDGFLLRLPERVNQPPVEMITGLSFERIREYVTSSLPGSPLFAIQFRHVATRALLLQRSYPGKRIPLWLQRLRASDLLQAVSKYTDFPAVVETYRTCMQDVFDMSGLERVIDRINSAEIEVAVVHSSYPSPMTSGLLFNFVSNTMYDYDRVRGGNLPESNGNGLLMQLLDPARLPGLLSAELIDEFEQRWQLAGPRDAEEMAARIRRLGVLFSAEMQPGQEKWLGELQNSSRVQCVSAGWISTENTENLLPNGNIDYRALLSLRLQCSGAHSSAGFAKMLHIPVSAAEDFLQGLHDRNHILRGRLLHNNDEIYWCHPERFAELHRAALARRRKSVHALDRDTFFRFSLDWHGIPGNAATLRDVISRYAGRTFPAGFFEREILYNRLCPGNPAKLSGIREELNTLIAGGEVVVRVSPGAIFEFFLRGNGHTWLWPEIAEPEGDALTVFQFLKENGASFFNDICNATGLSRSTVEEALRALVQSGLISGDDYPALFGLVTGKPASPAADPAARRAGRRMSRAQISSVMHNRSRLQGGRWYLLNSFSVMGKPIDEETCLERQSRLLLERYGIVVKEWHRQENGLLAWYPIFRHLKRMEWQDRLQRGYYFSGLPGLQFALPQAVQRLSNLPEGMAPAIVSLADPALPLGKNVRWDIPGLETVMLTRLPINHLLFADGRVIGYSENYGSRLWLSAAANEFQGETIAGLLKSFLLLPSDLRPRSRLQVEQIDGIAAAEHPAAGILRANKFEQEGKMLVLWPSAV
jgi:ATP-dependent Lhr-like helicase